MCSIACYAGVCVAGVSGWDVDVLLGASGCVPTLQLASTYSRGFDAAGLPKEIRCLRLSQAFAVIRVPPCDAFPIFPLLRPGSGELARIVSSRQGSLRHVRVRVAGTRYMTPLTGGIGTIPEVVLLLRIIAPCRSARND